MISAKKGEVVTVVLYLTRHATMDLDKVDELLMELEAASESELLSDTDTQSCHNYKHS